MKLITYLTKLEDLDYIVNSGVSEVILAPVLLSRFGNLSLTQTNEFAKKLISINIEPILEWDILMTQNVFQNVCEKLVDINLDLFKSIRVSDPGAINFILKNYPNTKIQLILESGAYHNTNSLDVMKSLIGSQLSRIILSLELNFEYLSEFIKKTDVEVEFLGLGRILLFYTPRKLITPLFGTEEKNYYEVNEIPIEVKASSEESAHKGFPVIENSHGTFMFNTKDHFVLEYLNELKAAHLDYLRIDLRFEKDLSPLAEINSLLSNFNDDLVKKIKNDHSTTVIRGFFHTNKTDVLFKKLKNQKINRVDDTYIGEVIDVQKGGHILVLLKSKSNKIKIDQVVFLTTTEGKIKEIKVNSLKNTRLLDLEEASYNDLVLIPYTSGATVRSIIHSC